MRVSRLALAAMATAAVLLVSLPARRSPVLAAAPAQAAAPAPEPAAVPAPPPHEHPAPTNLKVLPKDMTGEQVHTLMHQWAAELGTGCKTCHVADRKHLDASGKPTIDYADDSKEEKQTARKMYTMVEDINANYIAKIDSSGAPVTCGTCHRGHLGPEPFVLPDHPHDH